MNLFRYGGEDVPPRTIEREQGQISARGREKVAEGKRTSDQGKGGQQG